MARKKTGSTAVGRASPLSIPQRIVFGALPLLFLLGTGELFARACWSPESTESSNQATIMEPHPTRLWAPRPGAHTAFGGSFTINEDLLREVKRENDAIRVITLGDSSIFGHGVEDDRTLHQQLKRSLNEQSVQADVLCGAIPGYSTEQSMRLMDEWGWAQKPELLVIGNLWSDGARAHVSDREWYARYESPSARLDQTLMSWSALWTMIRSQVSEETETPVELIFERAPPSKRHGDRRVPLEDYAANLDQLLEQAALNGISTILLAPCHEMMLTNSEFQDQAQSAGYHGAMQAVAAHRGVPVVLACEVLRNAGIEQRTEAFVMMDPSQPALGNDPLHPSGRSNKAYAAEIARVLGEHGWPYTPLLARTDVGTFSQSLLPGPDNL